MAKTNKYALVTGGSRGIGREICLKLGGCGYHVLVNYKSNAAEAEKTLSGIRAAGGDGEALQFDVPRAKRARRPSPHGRKRTKAPASRWW